MLMVTPVHTLFCYFSFCCFDISVLRSFMLATDKVIIGSLLLVIVIYFS